MRSTAAASSDQRLTEAGTVVRLEGGSAVVEVERHGGCKGCWSASACLQLSDGETIRVRAGNRLGARPGDRVQLRVEPAQLVKASLTVYLLPLAGFFIGMFGGIVAEGAIGRGPEGLVAALGGALGLVAGLLALRHIDRRLARRRSPLATIVRVIESGSAGCTP